MNVACVIIYDPKKGTIGSAFTGQNNFECLINGELCHLVIPLALDLQVAKAAWRAPKETIVLTGPWRAPGEHTGLLSSGMKLGAYGRNRQWWERGVGCYSWGSNIGAEDTPCKGLCVHGPPGELCASATSRPAAMPPSLSFPHHSLLGQVLTFLHSTHLALLIFFLSLPDVLVQRSSVSTDRCW